MKQSVSTIIILLTLLFPTVSWGGVDGKGVLCENKDETVDGYFFSDTLVTNYEFTLSSNEKFEIKKNDNGEFVLKSNLIHWVVYPFIYTVDRKTLQLKMTDSNTLYQYFFDCEVYSKLEFFEKLEKIKNQYQSKYDDETKKNKI